MEAISDDDNDFMGGGGGLHNDVDMHPQSKGWAHQNRFVRTIKLRGTGWDGSHHQELMIKLQNNMRIRISRNNGKDTFQPDADKSRYNILVTREVSQQTITFRDVADAFNEAHRAHPAYDQANCRTFAQEIFMALDPGAEAAIKAASGGRGSNEEELKDLFGQ